MNLITTFQINPITSELDFKAVNYGSFPIIVHKINLPSLTN